ncbi:MAG: acetyl-CoA hydrolase/transferase family protein [Armatimonadetes bacterium]|nr:acetyl-CoA hydrolase/transferase family protein [Armatimonadota bacterium]
MKPSVNYVSADEALGHVRSGDRVYVGSNCGQPVALTDALARRDDLQQVEVVHLLTMGSAAYCEDDRFWHKGFFIAPNTRRAHDQGRADYVPVFLSEIPWLFMKGRMPLDVALVCVSPPDEHGFCSFGISVDLGPSACKSARLVIAEVDSQMPRTHGDSWIHIDDIDYFVASERPILEYLPEPPDDVSKSIAKHINHLVRDGATIQTGIGKIPSAVLETLTDKNDLGVHTEMFSDALIHAVDRGNINCRKKSLHINHVVSSFAIGSKELYEHVNDNPFYSFHPSEYVNDPFVVAQNEDMVAINGAIEVDLTGQVVSDSIGHRVYSGIGGQVDFIRGAARSRGGRPIIALPSVTNKGETKIVPTLKPGAGVVTSRGDVHYVVTEHGIADLHGQSLGERCEALIAVADPAYRDELETAAKELGIWRHPRWV